LMVCMFQLVEVGASVHIETNNNNVDMKNMEGGGEWRPVVLMHGILGTAEGMATAQQWIEADFPGIYVHNAEIGDGYYDSMLMDINEQVEIFAAQIKNDTKLQNGFNMICHSQGGLIGRAYIERYNNPPVYNFVSWASPHQGVYGVPSLNVYCPDDDCPWLDYLMDALLDGAWVEQGFQELLTFAAYWKDPFNYEQYIDSSIFLADINNERSINETYRKNFMSLNSVLLEYSEVDDIVIPAQSPWWYFYSNNSDSQLTPFNESLTYLDDLIGLKTMNNQGKLQFVGVPCAHPDIPQPDCKKWYDLYTVPYLNNTIN